jgi:hypothetical protein
MEAIMATANTRSNDRRYLEYTKIDQPPEMETGSGGICSGVTETAPRQHWLGQNATFFRGIGIFNEMGFQKSNGHDRELFFAGCCAPFGQHAVET